MNGYRRIHFENGVLQSLPKEVTVEVEDEKGGCMKSWGIALQAVSTQSAKT